MKPIPDDNWQAWTPNELFDRIGRFSRSWYLVGGWALDIWHGRQTRPHEDLEFAVLSGEINQCRKKLSELEFFSVVETDLVHLPASESIPSDLWQFWGADRAAGCWRVDMMTERGSQKIWSYKRQGNLRMPRAVAIRMDATGISYLSPALVLLFKAKYTRQKDTDDFESAVPKLELQEKINLADWLDALHPGHEWIARLKRSTDKR